MGSFTSKKKDTSSKSSYEPQGAKTDADKSFPPPPLQLKANKQDKLGTKETGSSPTESFSASQEVIQQKTKKKSTISAGEARKIIVGQTDKWGTDEAAIYSAIRSCNNRNALKTDDAVQNALVAEMGGHDLWKAYLLMEYGSESNFSSAINALWKATKGMGTDEDGVFQALEKMSARDKKSFKLDYILRCELSGDQLKKARNLIVTQDSIREMLLEQKAKKTLSSMKIL